MDNYATLSYFIITSLLVALITMDYTRRTGVTSMFKKDKGSGLPVVLFVILVIGFAFPFIVPNEPTIGSQDTESVSTSDDDKETILIDSIQIIVEEKLNANEHLPPMPDSTRTLVAERIYGSPAGAGIFYIVPQCAVSDPTLCLEELKGDNLYHTYFLLANTDLIKVGYGRFHTREECDQFRYKMGLTNVSEAYKWLKL